MYVNNAVLMYRRVIIFGVYICVSVFIIDYIHTYIHVCMN